MGCAQVGLRNNQPLRHQVGLLNLQRLKLAQSLVTQEVCPSPLENSVASIFPKTFWDLSDSNRLRPISFRSIWAPPTRRGRGFGVLPRYQESRYTWGLGFADRLGDSLGLESKQKRLVWRFERSSTVLYSFGL